jgi:hypothetical protein
LFVLDNDGKITIEDIVSIFIRVRQNPLAPEPTRLLNIFEFLMHDTDGFYFLTLMVFVRYWDDFC